MPYTLTLTDLKMENIQIYKSDDGTLTMSLNYTLYNDDTGGRIGKSAPIDLTPAEKTAVKNFIKTFVIAIAAAEDVNPPAWTQ